MPLQKQQTAPITLRLLLPSDQGIYIYHCRNCPNWYDVRDVGGDRADNFWLIVGGLILLLVLVSNGFFEPRNDNYPGGTPTFNETQD